MMFNFSFVRFALLLTVPTYLLLRYCTFLRRGTLEGYVVVVVVTLLLQFMPRAANALSIYLVQLY